MEKHINIHIFPCYYKTKNFRKEILFYSFFFIGDTFFSDYFTYSKRPQVCC